MNVLGTPSSGPAIATRVETTHFMSSSVSDSPTLRLTGSCILVLSIFIEGRQKSLRVFPKHKYVIEIRSVDASPPRIQIFVSLPNTFPAAEQWFQFSIAAKTSAPN
jgi:hypothetical protein